MPWTSKKAQQQHDQKVCRQSCQRYFGAVSEGEGTEVREHALRLATAVLMIDVARADHSFDENEFDRILELIRRTLRTGCRGYR